MMAAFMRSNPDWLYRAAWDVLREFKTRAPDRETARLMVLLKVAAAACPDEAIVLHGHVPKSLPPGFPMALKRMMTESLRELGQPYRCNMFFADEPAAWEARKLTLAFLMAQLAGIGRCDMTKASTVMGDLDAMAHGTEGVGEGWQDVLACLVAARRHEVLRFASSWGGGNNPGLVEYTAASHSRA
jgi:hypothetical protein